jgi:hypothetical protein
MQAEGTAGVRGSRGWITVNMWDWVGGGGKGARLQGKGSQAPSQLMGGLWFKIGGFPKSGQPSRLPHSRPCPLSSPQDPTLPFLGLTIVVLCIPFSSVKWGCEITVPNPK